MVCSMSLVSGNAWKGMQYETLSSHATRGAQAKEDFLLVVVDRGVCGRTVYMGTGEVLIQ